MSEVTRILESIEQGNPNAADQLLPLVYGELRKLAAAKMAKEAAGHTLQPTALVHEAWLRLVGNENPKFESRAHFFGAAAEAMRRILIEKARRKHAVRHGGGKHRTEFREADLASPQDDAQLLAVNEALDELALRRPLEAQVVKLRYFVGMTVEEAAVALDISKPDATQYWIHARAWLYRKISTRSY
jgi:RNA polymerase sigma factor (TIGR02999 family)